MIYFMRATDGTGPIKMGVSGNVGVRRDSLQRECGKELSVLAAVDGNYADEAIIRTAFHHLLVKGREWFEAGSDLLEFISAATSTNDLPPLGHMNEMQSARKVLGLTQAGMAKAIGLSQSCISKMESGALKIDRRTSLAIFTLKAKKEGKK